MTDPYQEARRHFSQVDSLISRIQSAGAELSRLQSSPPRQTEGDDPGAFQARQRQHQAQVEQVQNALSGLKQQLSSLIFTLSQCASRLQDLSGRYGRDAGVYGGAAQQAEVYGAQQKAGEAASYARQSAQEKQRQAQEVRQVIQRAQGALNTGSGGGGWTGSSGSLDDLLGDALGGLKTSPSSYHVDMGRYGSYEPSLDSSVYGSFSAYRPGAYTLYDSGSGSDGNYGRGYGMGWFK